MLPDKLFYCKECRKKLPSKAFYTGKRTKSTLSSWCKDCSRKYAFNRTRMRNLGIKLWLIKQLGSKCSKCGFDQSTAALDFHRENGHLRERHKEYLEWFKVRKIPPDVILLCANCHRMKHLTNFDPKSKNTDYLSF